MLGDRRRSASTNASVKSPPAAAPGWQKLRKLIVSYAETMTTDYGKSLVRFDVRDLTEHNRKIVRLAKKKIDRAFRDYIGQGIADGSIRPCDVKLSAFAIAGSLNWIGHWYQPGGALVGGGHRRRIRDPPHRRARDEINTEKGGQTAGQESKSRGVSR